jgi:Na+(H+)/acetate symporter ActP
VLGVIAVPVMLVTAEVVEPVARLALLVAGAVFVPALVTMFTPRANRWFRTRGPV